MSDDHDRTEINAIELLELLGEDFDELPGLERLRLAGKVAPRMRGATESLRKRRWSVENPEGAVVGETTPEEFWQSLVKAEKLSLDVGPGVRPKAVSCRYCGDLIVVGRRGPVRTVCSASCPAAPVCAGGCGKRAPTSALHRSAMARRRAKTGTDQWRCGSCRSSNNWAQRTPEARARLKEANQQRWDAMTDEERETHRAIGRAWWASLTDEERASWRKSRLEAEEGKA